MPAHFEKCLNIKGIKPTNPRNVRNADLITVNYYQVYECFYATLLFISLSSSTATRKAIAWIMKYRN